jgi:two-component system chemotaxis response regulator CheY
MKMMLVDDSQTMRRIQRTQLNGMGITDIVEASNGEEAMSVLKANSPIDIILLDWNMPVMDGITFLKAVRADASFANVKIVMCTSEAEKIKVVDAIKAGANNYIVKPFTPEALKEKLGV